MSWIYFVKNETNPCKTNNLTHTIHLLFICRKEQVEPG
ncbi:hypothetical protein H206_05482 [Candidatus Electrothrix aarhusensis]|uniref:Uncharacterized protein n=1 Tax=Candidatus Electrothrix aarhusensis TaxID=1859131 RepID=A0A444J4I4_9BACT|nr:hypothetical protein H206_05482 [Candidatus Electrothrix aarhusensis]